MWLGGYVSSPCTRLEFAFVSLHWSRISVPPGPMLAGKDAARRLRTDHCWCFLGWTIGQGFWEHQLRQPLHSFVVLITGLRGWQWQVSQSSTDFNRSWDWSGNRPGHPKSNYSACRRFLLWWLHSRSCCVQHFIWGTSDNWIVAKVLYTLLVINIFPTKR